MSAQGTKRSVARSGQTCTNCRTHKVKCERTDAAEGAALPPCKRCAKHGDECELYTGDGRTHTAQRNLAAKKRAEMEATCAGFLALFATLHQLDGPEYPRDTQRGYLESLVKDVVPNIAAAAPEFRAQAGFAEEVKRICDLFVGAQELFPPDGSKLEEIREWTRRWVKSANRFHRAWTALLVLFLSMLLDYPGQSGFVRKNLEDVRFGTLVISDTGVFVHWRRREEQDIEPHLHMLEEQCKVLQGPSHDALKNAWREAVTAYQKSLCEGVTGLRFENGVLVETIGETSRKRRGQSRAGSAVAEAAQQALPRSVAGPDAPILIEDEEMPDADEPVVHNPGTDTSGPLQVQDQADDFVMDVDGPSDATAAVGAVPAPVPAAEIPPAPAPVPTAGAAANPEVAPLDRQAQPYEVPGVYEPTVLQQQQRQQHLLPLLPQQQQQHQQQQMMQQAGSFAMPATTNPYTQTNMGMGMGPAGWQQAPQPRYQQAFVNVAYTPLFGNSPVGMGFNVAMPQQQMAIPTQQPQQQQYPPALYQQPWWTQQNAWRYAQPQYG